MAFTNTKANVKKVNYKVWVSAGTTSFPTVLTENSQIGAISAEPTLMEEKGDEQRLADGSIPVVSKNVSVDVTVLNVTKANREALLECINVDTSVYFQAESNWGTAVPTLASPASGDWVIKNVNIFPATSIKGQTVNQIQITGTKEVPPTDVNTLVAG